MDRDNSKRPIGAPRPLRSLKPVGHLHLRKPLWHHVHVARIGSDDPRLAPVKEAVAALKAAEEDVKRRRAELGKAVAEAIRAEVKPADLVRETGKSAESIRTMARANGIDPLRDPRGATKAAVQRAAERAEAEG